MDYASEIEFTGFFIKCLLGRLIISRAMRVDK